MPTPISAEQAIADARAAGYEPQEPYPGHTGAPWRARCTEPTCGALRIITAARVRQDPPYRCKHRARLSAEDALQRVQAAGYEPTVPYSGDPRKTWPCRCVTCGRIRCVNPYTPNPCSHKRPPAGVHAGAPDQDYLKLLELSRYKPLGSLPIRARERFAALCELCNTPTTVTRNTLRVTTRARGWKPRKTCNHAITRHLKAEELTWLLEVCRFVPMSDSSPRDDEPTPAWCVLCSTPTTVNLWRLRETAKRRGDQPRTQCPPQGHPAPDEDRPATQAMGADS